LSKLIKRSLSRTLLGAVLLCAVSIGVLLSCAQIAFDAYKVQRDMDADAQRILLMFRAPSTQAIFALDREMAMQVIGGLFQHQAITRASIGHPDEVLLAEKHRPLATSRARWVTDSFLSAERSYSIRLVSGAPYNDFFGDLRISLDTAFYGEEFLSDSAVILLTGMLRALVMGLILYMVYHWLLTRPLAKIIGHLAHVDPQRPGEHKLTMPAGHEQNEIGLWVRTANELLESIQHTNQLRHLAEENLQRMSRYDALTGLPNRLQFQLQLEQILEAATRHDQRVAVLCVGLDDFKAINEQFSYELGDQLLIAMTGRMRTLGGSAGTLARLGGDQFVLVHADIGAPYKAAELAQRVLDELDTPFLLDQAEVSLRATIGVALFPEDGDLAEKLLQKAEQTMTLAKTRSRHRYQFYIASVDNEMRRRRDLDRDLRSAVCRQELHLVYQPQIDYVDQKVRGVEALLRWHHPQHGMVPPDQFITLAEQSGSIIQIGEWVLDQACQQLRRWLDEGLDVRMAVNLSAVQLHHAELPRLVENLIQTYRLPAGYLELEVTETGLMEDVTSATQHLLSLRQSGALIAIDDFGTGYSSLSYLRTLPLDKIKIDRSFVKAVLEDDDDATIVCAIIQLARNLGMQVIAEGVEDHHQEAYLIAHGCNQGQGYLYSRPVTAAECQAYIRRQHGLSTI
jgi:diguanylate cyclase (GGDEF)-like protein